MAQVKISSCTREEDFRALSDEVLIHIAKNVTHYEAKENQDALVLELARRLEQAKQNVSNTLNLLLKDGWE